MKLPAFIRTTSDSLCIVDLTVMSAEISSQSELGSRRFSWGYKYLRPGDG